MKTFSQIELKKYREEFPTTQRATYFNHASLGPIPKRSQKELESLFASLTSSEITKVDPQAFVAYDKIKEKVGEMINAQPDEVGFCPNTSYGLNIAAWGLDLKKGDKVLLSDIDFPANVYPWLNLRKKGVKIEFIPSTNRFFDIDNFLKAIDEKTKVLSLSFVQFFNGFRNDLETIGEICEEKDIFFVVDGIQGVGVLDFDVKKCKIDFLSCGGQKWLLSLPGSGFFYLSSEAKAKVEPVFFGWLGLDWHMDFTDLLKYDLKPLQDMRKFDLGSYPYMSIWTMLPALKLLLEIGIQNIEAHTSKLLDTLIDYLSDSPYEIKSSLDSKHRSSILSFSGKDNKKLFSQLSSQNILCSFREGAIRISPHFYNSQEEMDKLIEILKQNEQT